VAAGHLDADCFYVSAERVRDVFPCKKGVDVSTGGRPFDQVVATGYSRWYARRA
jgi:hypothetical protein